MPFLTLALVLYMLVNTISEYDLALNSVLFCFFVQQQIDHDFGNGDHEIGMVRRKNTFTIEGMLVPRYIIYVR